MNSSFRFVQKSFKTTSRSCFKTATASAKTTTESFAQKFKSGNSNASTTTPKSSSIPSSFGSFGNFCSSSTSNIGNGLVNNLNRNSTVSISGFPLLELLCLIKDDDDDDR